MSLLKKEKKAWRLIRFLLAFSLCFKIQKKLIRKADIHNPISKQKKLEHSAKPHVDELIIEQKLAEWWSVVSILLLLSH
jgi:hypothetical protein